MIFMLGLKNRLRRVLSRNIVGRLFLRGRNRVERVRFVVATRLPESEFWRRAAAGRSLGLWKKDANVEVSVVSENKSGLSSIYNRHIDDASSPEAIVFMHDDVWIDDNMLLEKIRAALQRFDVVGVAGNRRRVVMQPAWLFARGDPVKGFELDAPNLSGQIFHGRPGYAELTVFGPTPAECELMDGVFLAVRLSVLRASEVRFDERFTFDFYDMDFCRTARRVGLSLGTWPISLIHESVGNFKSDGWRSAWSKYKEKWRR